MKSVEEFEENYKKMLIKSFKTKAAKSYKDGYAIYALITGTDTDERKEMYVQFIVWDNSIDTSLIRDELSYEVKELSAELELDVDDFYYDYYEVNIEELTTDDITNLIFRFL